jgi:hypothetical protein
MTSLLIFVEVVKSQSSGRGSVQFCRWLLISGYRSVDTTVRTSYFFTPRVEDRIVSSCLAERLAPFSAGVLGEVGCV